MPQYLAALERRASAAPGAMFNLAAQTCALHHFNVDNATQMPVRTHEEFFDTMPNESRVWLVRIQKEVESRIPDASRCIGYGMPAFRQKRTFFYFAAFKKHIGIYPPVTDDTLVIEETRAYRGPKGNLSFPLGQEIPIQLIGKVAVALSRQYASSQLAPKVSVPPNERHASI